MQEVRTRFAPSPTGLLHVGAVRTALFAWAFAKSNNGKFILRIEDTDKSREVQGATEHIIESLEWLGISVDEGPNAPGDLGPYIQSMRLDIYKRYAQQLINDGHAYTDPYSTAQVAEFREEAKLLKQPFLYRQFRPEDSKLKVEEDWYKKSTLRFKTTIFKPEWHDIVRGDLSAGEESLDDFVLIKADGYPTYNFAHIVDDFEMKISHIMRGEEFIASTPKFLALYKALGITPPKMATMPPILNQNGGKKLSKRDGAKDVLEYRSQGFLSEGVFNFLAGMGWNDGTEQEVFSRQEIVDNFTLERIQKSGAKFDDQRLVWLNGHHIRNMPTKDLFKLIDDEFWPEAASKSSSDYRLEVLGLLQERLKYFAELPELSEFFFEEPNYNQLTIKVKKLDDTQRAPLLKASIECLDQTDFTVEALELALRELAQTKNLKPGTIFGLLRIAATGSQVAPGLFETLAVLGKETTLRRLTQALDQL